MKLLLVTVLLLSSSGVLASQVAVDVLQRARLVCQNKQRLCRLLECRTKFSDFQSFVWSAYEDLQKEAWSLHRNLEFHIESLAKKFKAADGSDAMRGLENRLRQLELMKGELTPNEAEFDKVVASIYRVRDMLEQFRAEAEQKNMADLDSELKEARELMQELQDLLFFTQLMGRLRINSTIQILNLSIYGRKQVLDVLIQAGYIKSFTIYAGGYLQFKIADGQVFLSGYKTIPGKKGWLKREPDRVHWHDKVAPLYLEKLGISVDTDNMAAQDWIPISSVTDFELPKNVHPSPYPQVSYPYVLKHVDVTLAEDVR